MSPKTGTRAAIFGASVLPILGLALSYFALFHHNSTMSEIGHESFPNTFVIHKQAAKFIYSFLVVGSRFESSGFANTKGFDGSSSKRQSSKPNTPIKYENLTPRNLDKILGARVTFLIC